MCGICDISNVSEPPIDLFTEEEIDRILLGIYSGIISTRNLDVQTYLKTAKKLTEGIVKGYGKDFSSVVYNKTDYAMMRALRHNVFVFSAAKNYQQVRVMSSLLIDEKINTYTQFKKAAKQVFIDYNENYLKVEYQSAIAQSRSASQWQEIEKVKQYTPMLTYHTVGDGRVRPTHEALNNITRKVDDKFWDKFMPPNGWNCRCTVLQSSDEPETSLKGFKTPDDVPDIFQFNPGKEKIIFSPKHPYFKVAQRDKDWAKQNFGLPI